MSVSSVAQQLTMSWEDFADDGECWEDLDIGERPCCAALHLLNPQVICGVLCRR